MNDTDILTNIFHTYDLFSIYLDSNTSLKFKGGITDMVKRKCGRDTLYEINCIGVIVSYTSVKT